MKPTKDDFVKAGRDYETQLNEFEKFVEGVLSLNGKVPALTFYERQKYAPLKFSYCGVRYRFEYCAPKPGAGRIALVAGDGGDCAGAPVFLAINNVGELTAPDDAGQRWLVGDPLRVEHAFYYIVSRQIGT